APARLLTGPFVPVPVHPQHRRRRGVDHTRLLAEALARRTGALVLDGLERTGDRTPQVGRSRMERVHGPQVAVRFPTGDAPARVVLLDDVVTTGATIAACAAALKAVGAAQVV